MTNLTKKTDILTNHRPIFDYLCNSIDLFMAIEYPAASWKDYELIDSGNGEKLERYGSFIMARPEPKALWDKSLSDSEWNRMIHTRFTPGAGFGKNGEHHFRLTSFSTLENTTEAMERFKKLK